MFKREWHDLPEDPSYPADLGELGYEYNHQGQFVHKETGKFFEFFTTDSDRANDVHKEAMHECAGQQVKKELFKYDVEVIYLTGGDGKDVHTEKPDIAHVSILASDVEALMKKSDVVVVIPDCNQDLGVVTYRELMRGGGLDRGSVLGLVKKLQETNLSGGDKEFHQKIEDRLGPLEDGMTAFRDVLPTEHVPGIIVLNPGQLLYSHDEEKNMSFPGWLAKPRSHALEDPATINENHNRTAGHKNPQDHISIVLEHIIPQLTQPKARLWVIAVSDGAEYLINYMDGRLSDTRKMIVPSRTVKAMALINSSHDPEQITNEMTKLKLSTRGKSWVLSEHPLGTTLTMADPSTVNARDYEGEVNSDPIAIPVRRDKGRSLSDYSEVRVGKPGKTPDQALIDNTNSPRRRRGATVSPGLFAKRPIPSVPLPSTFIGPYAPDLTIPPLNPFRAKAPSDGYSEASPTDEEKERAEKEKQEREEKEKLKYEVLAKTPSNDSYSDQSAAVSVASVDLKQPVPIRPFPVPGIPHRYSETTSVTDFGYETAGQITGLRATAVTGPGRDTESPERVCEYSPSEYSQDNDEAVYSDSGVDVPEDSSKMVGGDFDDSDDEEAGLRMKRVSRSPPVPELEEDVSSESSCMSKGMGEDLNEGMDEDDTEQLGWGVDTFSTFEQSDAPSGDDGDSEISASEPGETSGEEWGALVVPDHEVEGGVQVPEPEVGDMLRVSGGISDEVELILPNALDDVLNWFVAMSVKYEY